MNQRQTLNYFFVIILSLVYSILFGQSIQEMQRLKKEFEKLQQSQGMELAAPTRVEDIDPVTGLPRMKVVTPYKAADTLSIKRVNKNFGYDFFTKRDSVAFWENLPTPAIYLLGPGDELIISIWGETQLRETFTVNREGKIYDAKVGLLNITGKTMDEVRIYLKDQFARVYATLKGRNPTVHVAAATLVHAALEQTTLGLAASNLLEARNAHISATGTGRLVDFHGHPIRLLRRTRSSGPLPTRRLPSSTRVYAPQSAPLGVSCPAAAWF